MLSQSTNTPNAMQPLETIAFLQECKDFFHFCNVLGVSWSGNPMVTRVYILARGLKYSRP